METYQSIVRKLIIVTALVMPLAGFSELSTTFTACLDSASNVRCFQPTESAQNQNTGSVTGKGGDTTVKSMHISLVSDVSIDRSTRSNNRLNLGWTTSYEQSGVHFELERSTDGKNFKTIAIVLDGFPTNDYQKTYRISNIIQPVTSGTPVYYRLKEADIEGKEIYTTQLAVK